MSDIVRAVAGKNDCEAESARRRGKEEEQV
jgi:hypothetical protein